MLERELRNPVDQGNSCHRDPFRQGPLASEGHDAQVVEELRRQLRPWAPKGPLVARGSQGRGIDHWTSMIAKNTTYSVLIKKHDGSRPGAGDLVEEEGREEGRGK